MSTRSVVFRLIGFAGAVSIATGIHDIIRSADCSAMVMNCPVDPSRSIGLLAGGILAGVVGTIGGGFIVFASMFAAIGVGSVIAGVQSTGFGHGFGLLFGGIFLAASLIPAALALLGGAARKRTAHLVASGARGVATVLEVEDTGVTINDNPRVRLLLQVQPAGEAARFETTITLTVSRIDVPRRGEQRAVIFDPADHSALQWDPAGPPVRLSPHWPAATAPAPPYGTPAPPYGTPAPPYGTPGPPYGTPGPPYGTPGPAHDAPAPAYGMPERAGGILDELERLNTLHASNALTDEEFARLKARLLGETG